MNVLAGAQRSRTFHTIDPVTYLPADATATPEGILRLNGVDQEDVPVDITYLSTGKYRASWTVPTDYEAGDNVEVEVSASVSGIPGYMIVGDDIVTDPIPDPAGRLIVGPLRISAVDSDLEGSAKILCSEAYDFEFELVDGAGHPQALGSQTATATLTDEANTAQTAPTATVSYADGGRVRITGTGPSTPGTYNLSIEMSGGKVYDGFSFIARRR